MAPKTNRRRPDAITERDGYTDPIADGIHHAIKPLDKMATDMELKWGCDRLPSLVSPAMAAKFGSAKAKLDHAIELNGPQEVVHAVNVMLRGWMALDAEATKMGHQPLEPNIWSHTTEAGFTFAVAQGNAQALKAAKMGNDFKGVKIFSLDEIGRLLEADSLTLVNATKEHFPGATVTKINATQIGKDDVPW
tara:strand:+ start:988 stop:1563 length:576 start_codon:yes stop_codon:yes gene_type:complete